MAIFSYEIVTIEKLVSEGYGLGFSSTGGGKTFFIRKAYPGDEVEVEFYKRKGAIFFGDVHTIIQTSKQRIKPPCPYFTQCGGCPWQALEYTAQLAWKRKIIQETLEKIGKSNLLVRTVVPAPLCFAFRNKTEFSFGGNEESKPYLGFHFPQSHYRVVQIDTCLIQSELANKALMLLQDFFNQRTAVSTFEPGFLKSLTIRFSFTTQKILLELVTVPGDFFSADSVWNSLKKQLGDTLAGFLWVIEKQRQKQKTEKILQKQYGENFLEEKIGKLLFRISPATFFQTNTLQASNLVNLVIQSVQLRPEYCVLDLYCGMGLFGLACAPFCREVIGIEIDQSLTEAASYTAARNSISNFSVVTGKARVVLKKFIEQQRSFDVCIVDPPRAGLCLKVIERLSTLGPKRIVYVSCNPVTFARDCQIFSNRGFLLQSVQPIDMFPQTYHCEIVGVLESQ